MAQIVINNKAIVGNNISILNNKVIVDGKEIDLENALTVNIHVEGSVDSITADACHIIDIAGDAGTVNTISGDVQCADVHHSVQTTSGDVKCGDVKGFVKTVSGDVIANTVNGSVTTVSGDIHH